MEFLKPQLITYLIQNQLSRMEPLFKPILVLITDNVKTYKSKV